ncbi:MAG TPA: carboxypeptidase regulatory-like domain-containing protein [Ktedonobacterales bacterium]|nr:carboxypeptidase regulatory-like domain-containing protein [Ktedonobacterales bacterium]
MTGAQAASAQGKPLKPLVRSALKHDTTPNLRTMKPPKVPQGKTKIKDVPLHDVPHGHLTTAPKSGSAALQTNVVTNDMPSFGQNFEGVGNVNGVLPPDTQGDVGPNNYVQMVNLSFAIWDKQGNLLYGPVPNTTLWQGFGGPCETFNGGDPVTMYDEAADRWFMSQLAYPGGADGYHECIAISQTGDPTGAWYRYDFLYSLDTLNDYPKFGIWPDAYYMSANEFLNAATFTGAGVMAFDRTAMLAGQPANSIYFHVGDSSGVYGNLLPSDAEGQALGFNPPAGAPDPFLMFDDDAWGFSPTDRLLMWDFHVDWGTPANSTFGNNGVPNRFFETAPFDSNLCNYSRSCIPQPNTSVGLDTLSDRLMYRAAYRNFGDHQAIVLDHSVDVNGSDHAGVRWYELTNPGSGWSLDQQGTYAPDTDNRWMGSAALDASGDIAIGFSVSSSSTFPSIRVAGRLVSDPAGDLSQGETTLIAGGGSQTHPASRWGDYAAMQVDPTDGCTFWFTTEYMPTTSSADWHTRIGSFKFPSCSAGPHGTLTGTVTDASNNQPIAGATVSTNVASTTTDGQGHYSLTLAVGTYDVTFSAFGYASKTDSGVAISDGGTTTDNAALTPSQSVHVAGTVTDGSGHGWPLYTRIEITGRPGGPIYTDPATGHYSVDLPANATYSVKYTATLPGYQVVNDSIVVGGSDVTHDVAIPVEQTCTAPGYHFAYGTPVLNEPFDGSTMPAGWTVVDSQGEGHAWQIGDPENRGNLTGGSGNFADINSDFYGPGNHQDTSLISPAFDLSSVSAPYLRFHNDYVGFPGQTGDVDVSTDGGQNWTNVWHHGSDSVPGPDLEEVAIPQAAGHSSVQVRFHFTSTWGWWWQVDDVSALNRACTPVPGGLVVGTVSDANTNAGLNGATVTSTDKPAEKATTAATPDDPNLGDGYYWMFSSLTGGHPFSATKGGYQADSQTVNVAADGSTRADFTLKAGRLSVNPTSVSQSLVLGSTGTATVTLSNTGTAAADVKLSERGGAFQILTLQGSPLRMVHSEDDEFTPAWLGGQKGDNEAGVSAGSPRDPTWSTIAPYPNGIMDNGGDIIDGKVYVVGGVDATFATTAKGFVYDPDANTWTPIADMPVAREKPAVVAANGLLYVTGGWDTSGNPISRTDVYDPASNSWSTVAANPHPAAAPGAAVADGKIYLVGGCADAFCTTTTTVVSYDPATDTWNTLAAYPHTDAWEACGGIDGKVYCAGGTDGAATFKNGFAYDPGSDSWSPIADMPIDLWASAVGAPNGMLVVSSGVTNGFSTVTNQGVAYDPSTDSWTALPNAQFPRYRSAGSCGFYKVGGSSGGFSPTAESEHLSDLDQCGATDVPWLAETPTTATLQPGQSVTVTITLSATTAATVTQPGTFSAQLGVSTNTPYRVDPIGITMTVTPPKGWGKITGTVTGTDCNGNSTPLRGVQIQANGKGYSFSLKTDANGKYTFWAPAASNSYTLIASKDGWVAQTLKTNIKAGKTVTVNFDLHPPTC